MNFGVKVVESRKLYADSNRLQPAEGLGVRAYRNRTIVWLMTECHEIARQAMTTTVLGMVVPLSHYRSLMIGIESRLPHIQFILDPTYQEAV